jgi:hypothetical protein
MMGSCKPFMQEEIMNLPYVVWVLLVVVLVLAILALVGVL